MAGGLVWTISQAGTLYGLDPRTGQVRQQGPLNRPPGATNHFPTPSVGAGLLLAPAGNRVVAFRAGRRSGQQASRPAAGPGQHGPASTAPSAHASAGAQPGGAHPPAGLSGGAIAGIVAGRRWCCSARRLAGYGAGWGRRAAEPWPWRRPWTPS